MNILALWSGGLDSTYMLKMLSEQGHRVKAGYVEFLNNETKIVREKTAIDKLIEAGFTKAFNIEYLGTIHSITLNDPRRNFGLCQPLVWLHALASMVEEDTDAIAVGYILGDDAISFLSDFQKIYKSFKPLVYHSPKLIFPLTKTSKITAWKDLGHRYTDLISWCENAGDTDRCGNCIPCRKMQYLDLWRGDATKANEDQTI